METRNIKTMLCHKVITKNECSYARCIYAHSLEEQVMSPIRTLAYNVILSDDDLRKINLNENKDLYNELCTLTNECINCINNNCIGGNNCKYGTNNKKKTICYADLHNGKCEDSKCYKVHLSKKNLIPYNLNKISNISLYPIELLTSKYVFQ